ncbi:LysR family transcriptional regulator [Rhodococcus hoagii]|jgi:DNA-binding transcriptional LysR family regulator|uniref:LysR substrate binding domain protein n=3 Tax=Rhodococcus hoagii TaxID=43767 RepID=E9T306_RHOHA|nr:LysR family transcriptional regulator [Prescottella equi]MBU4614147.1 LysR family transcriptional regulator [Rhodococcus sp. GG48]MCD7051009.1 LysR family transcriptional regulator [Rhodococcus sp. BH2-1]GBF12789.1 HTH-type transcriptional activator CmpR [Rhodococcus sp. Br-6]AVP69647.1 LysR family transcriptional regulator [Prescottella equi]EGD23218.1 LysR substrate binding domain protein [Prescottella equi ATCC 33707]
MPLSNRVPELAALDVLVAVGRLGSMGAAGREHGLSQQAVSARVRSAERQLGLRVFDRGAGGVQPTAEGALILEWASAILDSAEEMASGVAALRGERDANLTVAASMTIAEYLVPGWTVAMRRKYPNVVTSVRLLNSTDVAAQVRAGEADLGFVEGPTAPDGLRAVEVAHDELVVIVPPDHKWIARAPIDPSELAATPLIQREPGSGTRTTLEHAVPGCVDPLLELTSCTAVKAAVVAGNAPAVVSSLAVEADLHDGRLASVPVQGLRMPRRLLAVWDGSRGLRGAARDFLDIACGRS